MSEPERSKDRKNKIARSDFLVEAFSFQLSNVSYQSPVL